jgi:hypothetical protein
VYLKTAAILAMRFTDVPFAARPIVNATAGNHGEAPVEEILLLSDGKEFQTAGAVSMRVIGKSQVLL